MTIDAGAITASAGLRITRCRSAGSRWCIMKPISVKYLSIANASPSIPASAVPSIPHAAHISNTSSSITYAFSSCWSFSNTRSHEYGTLAWM